MIQTMAADFVFDALDVREGDGILMANSLHYVKNKETLLKKLISSMKTNGIFLIVELRQTSSNQLGSLSLTLMPRPGLFKAGLFGFSLLNKRTSMFGRIYHVAALP
jgi:ubiquinone/menaquinone biosynthesis C-methylase UbiE